MATQSLQAFFKVFGIEYQQCPCHGHRRYHYDYKPRLDYLLAMLYFMVMCRNLREQPEVPHITALFAPWTRGLVGWIMLSALIISFQAYLCAKVIVPLVIHPSISYLKRLYLLAKNEVRVVSSALALLVQREIANRSRQEKYLRGSMFVWNLPSDACRTINAKAAGHPSTQSAPSSNQICGRIKLNYMAFPAELRNNIAKLALVRGRIHLPPVLEAMEHPVQVFSWNPRFQYVHQTSVLSRVQTNIEDGFTSLVRAALDYIKLEPTFTRPVKSAVGLLAASRQTYDESHGFYWASNTFYLPRGPVNHSQYYWGSIDPRHKALIRSIAIQFSLADLTPEVLDHIEKYARVRYAQGRQDGRRPQDLDSHSWRYYTHRALTQMWARKLIWIRAWEGLDELRLEAPCQEPLVLKGRDMGVTMRGIGRLLARNLPQGRRLNLGFKDLCDLELRQFMEDADTNAHATSSSMILSNGWEAFKESVSEILREESQWP